MNWFKKKIVKPIEARLPNQDEDDKINVNSATWQAVRVWAEKELNDNREANDKTSLDIIKTSVIRGEIRILKALLSLPGTK